jgi:hypothetical protein
MSDHFAVVDMRSGKVIEQFASRKLAKTFASDFRTVYHCMLPKVIQTTMKLKPGDIVQ